MNKIFFLLIKEIEIVIIRRYLKEINKNKINIKIYFVPILILLF